MKTVLITGGGGFISSSVIKILLDGNYKVIVLDNNFKNTCDRLIPFVPNKNFEFILGDVTEESILHDIFDKYRPDYTLHMAALVGFPICNKYKQLASVVNFTATKVIARKAHYFHSKLLFPSTGSVYKPGQSRCDENAEVKPPSHYGRTKLLAEHYIRQYPNIIIHRYGTAMGVSFANIRTDLLANHLTLRSYLDRTITLFEHTFLRSFIHVRDIASAIVHTIEKWDDVASKGRLFNVSNNDLNFTKGELASMISSKLGTNVCYAEYAKDLDQRNYLMDNDLFYSTGWQPTIGMDETIDELIKVAPMLTQENKYA
jgi:nucleoside-diphosphate-sugar epimerase